MRKTLMALAVLSILALPAAAQSAPIDAEAPAPTTEAAPAPEATVTTEEAPVALRLEPGFEAIQQSYPSCSQVAGTPCSAGQTKRCQWTPYEPEVCWCNEGTFQCGNLH